MYKPGLNQGSGSICKNTSENKTVVSSVISLTKEANRSTTSKILSFQIFLFLDLCTLGVVGGLVSWDGDVSGSGVVVAGVPGRQGGVVTVATEDDDPAQETQA